MICQFIGLLFVIEGSGWGDHPKGRADGVPEAPAARIRQPEVNRRSEAESEIDRMPHHDVVYGLKSLSLHRSFSRR